MLNTKRRYSLGEEIFNCIVHGMGAGLAIAGTVILIVYSAISKDVWAIVANSVYGASIIIFFTISTIYHALSNFNARNAMRYFDTDAVFFLIAGTYTPFCLTAVRGPYGWVMFGIVWALAAVGIVFTSVNYEKFSKFAPPLYAIMGWGAVIFTKPMLMHVSRFSMGFLLLGALILSIGAIIYAMKKFKCAHCVWHVFTLLGVVCHFFAVMGLIWYK